MRVKFREKSELLLTSAARILIACYKAEQEGITKLTKDALSKRANLHMQSVIKQSELLDKEGLVKLEVGEKFPFQHWISLTEKGRRIAEFLAKIEEELKS